MIGEKALRGPVLTITDYISAGIFAVTVTAFCLFGAVVACSPVLLVLFLVTNS